MFGSTVLDVAIGLVYVYLLLSLLCMALNEWIAGIWSLRAKTLEQGIRRLLNDPSGLADGVLTHPLIAGLAKPGRSPSYIPANLFATALLQQVATGAEAGTVNVQSLWALKSRVDDLPSSPLKVALQALIQQAGGDLAQARQNIEDWFNAAMDRVSGWYKRRAQVIVICLGVFLCVLLNADTFMIATGISRDPTLRAAIVAAVQKPSPPSSATGTTGPQPPITQVAAVQGEIQQLKLPLGWSLAPRGRNESGAGRDPRQLPNQPLDWLVKVLGLAFTVIAISLGAPFWFQVLSVTLRATGNKPA